MAKAPADDNTLQNYTLHAKDENGMPMLIPFGLTDEENATLDAFMAKTERLADSKWLKNKGESGMTINWEADKGLTVEQRLPEWDDVIVVIHKFRPFGLQKERTYFPNVAKILSRRIENDLIKGMIKHMKEEFSGKYMQSAIRIEYNDTIINGEQLFNDWLNAYEYHEDLDKLSFFASLPNVLTEEMLKPIWCHLLIDKIDAVYGLGHIITARTKDDTAVQ